MSFKVGDKVIYPNHGLGVVEKVEEKTIMGTTCGFFHLRILSNETTVLVPVANVDNVGLRRAITDEEVERLFGILGDGVIDNHANWKGRFKDNSDKMRSGSIYDMCDVLKSLTFLAKSKSLSFREKRMLDRAKSLIVSEVSEVLRVAAGDIELRVEKTLEQCFVVKAQNKVPSRSIVVPPAPPVGSAPRPGAVSRPPTPARQATPPAPAHQPSAGVRTLVAAAAAAAAKSAQARVQAAAAAAKAAPVAKSAKPASSARLAKPAKAAKPVTAAKAAKTVKPAKAAKPVTLAKSAKSVKPVKTLRAGKSAKSRPVAKAAKVAKASRKPAGRLRQARAS